MIVVENLRKVYENGPLSLEVLKGIDLKVESEEYVALMGPSGSGKSTFMNILGCLDQLTSGKYYLDGIDISTMTQDELSAIRNQKLGFIFQSFNLLPKLSSLENVILPAMYANMPKKERYERGVEALTAVGLGDRVHHKPNELSGGQRQRVAIARSIINTPKILLRILITHFLLICILLKTTLLVLRGTNSSSKMQEKQKRILSMIYLINTL